MMKKAGSMNPYSSPIRVVSYNPSGYVPRSIAAVEE